MANKVIKSIEIVDVDLYPVPFKDNLKMSYKFETSGAVKIEVFDIRGALLSTQTDADVHIDKEISIDLHHTLPSQMNSSG